MPEPAQVSFTPGTRFPGFTVAASAAGSLLGGDTAPQSSLMASRGNFEAEMRAALSGSGVYPTAVGNTMAGLLGPIGQEAVGSNPASIRFTMAGESWLLLPEMVPSRGVWLDQLAPCFRVRGVVEPGQAKRPEAMSVAILAQSGNDLDFER